MNQRRKFLGQALAAGASFSLLSSVKNAIAGACGVTPPQTPGPFYPGETLFHADNDLTRPASGGRPLGQVIYVQGQVLDAACRPISQATVEIWQACASGRYDNPNDANPAPLDPNFKYWGETSTDREGRYIFKTIIPGAYPADVNWKRPPHIHFKVSRLGFHELVTQMYFQGETLNDIDEILLAVPQTERASVIVSFVQASAELEPGALQGTFNITMQSVKGLGSQV